MRKTALSILIFASLAAILTVPAEADSRFTIRRMERADLGPGRGFCEIRLQVDDTVEVTIEGDRVFIHTLSGQDARDDGSTCNFPLPGRDVEGFRFDVREKRGEIQLVEGPSRNNGGKVVVRIHDGPGGFGRYIFQLSWMMGFDRGGPPPPPPQDERRDDDRRMDGDRRMDERRDFRILNATWGAPGPGQNREVTRLLQERIRDGRLRIRASNEEMGFDPALNVVKSLFVVYEVRGRRQEVRVREGDLLELP